MTDLEWLRGQLARFAYRPGWSLMLDYDPVRSLMASASLTVVYHAPDSRDPSRTIPIRATAEVPYPITDARDEGLFARWLQNMLFDVERHESREWLRRDGRIFDDPHA